MYQYDYYAVADLFLAYCGLVTVALAEVSLHVCAVGIFPIDRRRSVGGFGSKSPPGFDAAHKT